MNQDELLARLQGFEWNDFECKKAQRGVPEDAYKTVSAFANTAGGWIVFGISDHNGQMDVSGVAEPDKVQNPAIVKAFRRIGLSDQAGTGIRAIFRNWHDLGRIPPQITNDKAQKQFDLVLLNKPLVTEVMQRFRQSIGVNLTPEQSDVLALALEKPQGDYLNLTEIRSLGISTIQQAKAMANYLVSQQLLESVSETLFQVRVELRQRFANSG